MLCYYHLLSAVGKDARILQPADSFPADLLADVPSQILSFYVSVDLLDFGHFSSFLVKQVPAAFTRMA